MIAGLLGAKASAPMASEAWSSVFGDQVTPVSRVSHTPPIAPPTSQWALLVGSTAMLTIRPEVGSTGVICAFMKGAGPKLIHCGPPPMSGCAARAVGLVDC